MYQINIVKQLIFRDHVAYYMLNCSILMTTNKPTCVWYNTQFMYTIIWYHKYPKVRSSLFLSFSQWMPFSPTRPRDRNHHPLTSETCQHPTSDALPLSNVCISCTYSRSVCDNLSSQTHSCEAFASLISFRQSPTYNYLASPALRQPFLLLFLHINSQIAV